jgi:hypothetical protein
MGCNSNCRIVITGRHCEPEREGEAIQTGHTLDCFVPRNDDGNPLNLRPFELKIDVVKYTPRNVSFDYPGKIRYLCVLPKFFKDTYYAKDFYTIIFIVQRFRVCR